MPAIMNYTSDIEADRIAALVETGLLDTSQDERFDRYTRLASALTDCPIALITLLDDKRQWFKSRVGLDVDETPRSDAFCDYTIRGQNIMIVEDTLKDPRFVNNALVTGDPFIRFYAGVPLWLSSGHCIGALCVIDRKPRSGDELTGLRELEDLAQTLTLEIEAHTKDSKRAQAMADQEIVIAELKHRMGNLYTNVAALIRNSDDGLASREDFSTQLQNRVNMMAHAQRRLAERDFRFTDLSALVGDAVRDFGGTHGASERIVIDGAPCSINPRSAMSIALMIHELGTNALKHGALRDADGRVNLSWRQDESRFHIEWVENTVAHVPQCDETQSDRHRVGFGSTLLYRIIPMELGGTLDKGFGPNGFFYKLQADSILLNEPV